MTAPCRGAWSVFADAAAQVATYRILASEETAGGGLDAIVRDESGREVRLWAGEPGSASRGELLADLCASLGKVFHASLPRTIGPGELDGRAALVVQPYRGETLADRLSRARPGTRDGLEIARSVAAALVKAHRRGVVHGAITSREILLAEDGRTLLLHLGMGPLLGPRPVRAPEDSATRRSESGDVFALARVLLECLLGEDPHGGVFVPDERSFPTDLPEGLRRFLARAAHPDPALRIHRAEEFAGDLGVILASWDSLGASPPAGFPGRRAIGLLGAALLLLAAVLGVRFCGP